MKNIGIFVQAAIGCNIAHLTRSDNEESQWEYLFSIHPQLDSVLEKA